MNASKVRKVCINRRADMADSVTRAWQERAPFDANGTLRGEYITSGDVWPMGRLHPSYRAQLLRDTAAAREAQVPMFVVWSYQTPIAWAWGDNVTKVAQRFSVTTSKHQGRLY